MPKPQGLTFTTMSGEELLRIPEITGAVSTDTIKATCRWAKTASAPPQDVWDVLGCLGLDGLAHDLLDHYRAPKGR